MVVSKMADLQLCQTSPASERHSSSSSKLIPRDKNSNSCFSLAAVEAYEPVGASQKGEGWPYAPEGWPKPGDKWFWKVGRRKHAKGYWQDRYLLLPKRLQKGRSKVCFWSKKSVEEFIKSDFPGTDVNSFFGSFQWKVPYATATPTSLRDLGLLQGEHSDWCIYLDGLVGLFWQHDDLLVYCHSAIQNLN